MEAARFPLVDDTLVNPLMLAYVLPAEILNLPVMKGHNELGNEQRADYTRRLFQERQPTHDRSLPVSLGEVGVRRVKSVMNYKKPAFWIIILAIIACWSWQCVS